MTRHKSTVTKFLSKKYDWFFAEYNSKLLESTNYITRRLAIKESSNSIQTAAFYVFKLFAANPNKPSDIVNILVANKSKLLGLLADLSTDKEDEEFDVDKAQIMAEIASLEPKDFAEAEFMVQCWFIYFLAMLQYI